MTGYHLRCRGPDNLSKPFSCLRSIVSRTVKRTPALMYNLYNRKGFDRCALAAARNRHLAGKRYLHNRGEASISFQYFSTVVFFQQVLHPDYHIPSAETHQLLHHTAKTAMLRI